MTVEASSAKGGDYNRRMTPGLVLVPDRSMAGRAILKTCKTLDIASAADLATGGPQEMTSNYQLLTSEAEYRQACDTILRRAEHEILIFDRDLVAMRLEDKARLEALAGFLQAGDVRKVRIVLHDPGPLERDAPRLTRLIFRFSHLIEVRQSPDNLRHLADTHLIADESHGVRRFHVDQPRSAAILDDPTYINPWRQRFEELWELSHPCLTIHTTGL